MEVLRVSEICTQSIGNFDSERNCSYSRYSEKPYVIRLRKDIEFSPKINPYKELKIFRTKGSKNILISLQHPCQSSKGNIISAFFRKPVIKLYLYASLLNGYWKIPRSLAFQVFEKHCFATR